MAITVVSGSRATGAVAAAGFDEPMDLPAGGSIAVGNFLILVAAYDNSGTSGVDPQMVIASSSAVTADRGIDLRGNYWFRVAKAVRTSGVASDGAVADIWICRVNNAYTNGDDITVQFSFSAAAFVYRIFEVSGMQSLSYSPWTPATSTGSSTAIAIAGPLTAVSGALVVGVAGWETNTAVTVDADVFEGSWVTVNNSGYNSGVDATSQTLVSQYKITTGGSAQTWNLSKTGAADFAGLLVAFAPAVPVTDTTPTGNTHYPCPAGPEILPVGDARVGVDVGTEYLFTHDIPANYDNSRTYIPLTALVLDSTLPFSSVQQHIIAADLYDAGDEMPIDSVQGVVLSVSAAAGSGTTVVGGGTVADALASPGGSYVQIPSAGPYVDVTFNPTVLTSLFQGYRVMRIGIRYLAWKDNSAPAIPGEGMEVHWRDSRALGGPGGQFTAVTAGDFSPGAFLINNYRYQVGYELRWLGETNMLPRAKTVIDNLTAASGASFTVQDLENMAAPNYECGFRIFGMAGEDPLQTDIFLDYIELIVELAPERRMATGMRKVSSITPTLYPAGTGASYWFDPDDTTDFATVFDGGACMAIREALPPSPSDYYSAKTNISGGARQVGDTEAVGPTLQLGGVDVAWDSLADQPNIRRASLSNGLIASPPSEMNRVFLAATTVDLMSFQIDGSVWPAYYISNPGTINQVNTFNAPTQYVVVPGGQQYDAVKVLVRPDELTTGSLTITVEKPLSTPLATATITVADYEASPKYGNWAEIIVPLSVAITPTSGRAVIHYSAAVPVNQSWEVSVALADSVINAYDPGDPDAQEYDYAGVLLCPLAAPTYNITEEEVAVPPAGFATSHCAPLTMSLPMITLTNGDLYDWVTIQRVVGAQVFDVALLESPGDNYAFLDYGCPWDLGGGSIYYIIQGYRATDHRIVESITPALITAPSAPGALFGLATNQGIWLYDPTESSGELEIEYNPLNPLSKVQLHGYDYQVALRSPEERGLAITVPVVVDSLGCGTRSFLTTELAPEFASRGQQAMSPTPFDPIRALEKEKRLQLVLPGGHHRWVILDAGSMTIRTNGGSYMAEIELTDALAPNLQPWPLSWSF